MNISLLPDWDMALQRSTSAPGQVLSVQPGSYKDHFMAGLRSKDLSVSAAAVRVLCGLLHNKSVDPEFLDAAGMPLTWMSRLVSTFCIQDP